MAGQIRKMGEPRLVGVVGDDIGDKMISAFLATLCADDAQRALAGKIVEGRSQSGHADVDVAGDGRDRDRLRRVEEMQIEIDSLGGEIATLGGDKDRARGGELQDADGQFFRRCRRPHQRQQPQCR